MPDKTFLRTVLSLVFCASGLSAAAQEFDPAGWDTNKNYPAIGSPEAKKGGTFRAYWPGFPPTLRTHGPGANSAAAREVHGLMYESLVNLHPGTLEYMPGLADYWKVSGDKRRFTFHINQKARWADGTPVTADDVVATWEFGARPDLRDPSSPMRWDDDFEKPVAESRDMVSVKTKKLHWRFFLYFGSMSIYPAKELSALAGERYLEEYDWKSQTGSGPYELKAGDIKKEGSITLTRRADYWAENEWRNTGLNNFDKISWLAIPDEELAFGKFKEGGLDYYPVSKARKWLEECDFEKIKKGWIQKRKIYTEAPRGFSGFAFNLRKPPFADVDVRKAFAYLLNREKLIDKLFFHEYDFLDSYYPGGVWENPDNPEIRFNPLMAQRLLEKAGWKSRNKDGWLVKDGKIFELTFEYGDPDMTGIYKALQEDLEKAGIRLILKQTDPAALRKKVGERNFTLHFQSWDALLFPDPASYWTSELADTQSGNNITGFKNQEADALCGKYGAAFGREEQKRIMRELDGIIFRSHPYALAWGSNFTRILYHDKFGHPKEYFSRTGDDKDMKTLWWIDPEKEKLLEGAAAGNRALSVGETIQKPWQKRL